MTSDVHPLMTVYKGWDGYQISLVRAIAPLSREQLAYRPASHLRSAGEIAACSFISVCSVVIMRLNDLALSAADGHDKPLGILR